MSYAAWMVCLTALSTLGALFFSTNACALRTFSHSKLQDAIKTTNKERIIDNLVKNTDRLVLSCRLYSLVFVICTVLLLLGAFAVSGHRGLVPYILAFAVAVGVLIVFAIALPQALAEYAGEAILSRSYRVLMLSATLAQPILYVVELHKAVIRGVAGEAQTTPEEEHEEKQEEFLTDLEQHRMEGSVDAEEQQMIENVLELSETTANEIMTPRTDVVAIEVNSDLAGVLETITKAGHSRMPVYEENIDNIVGLLYAKDLLREIGKDPADFRLREKIRQAHFVPEAKPIRTLLHEFQNQKLHIAIVLDEYGGTSGIVTLEDIIEELVGEISDEYDKIPLKPIKRTDHNTIEADARTSIEQINDAFELSLSEDDDYETIGGFVCSHFGYIPKSGESFDYQDLRFTVTSSDARRIKSVRIQKVSEQ